MEDDRLYFYRVVCNRWMNEIAGNPECVSIITDRAIKTVDGNFIALQEDCANVYCLQNLANEDENRIVCSKCYRFMSGGGVYMHTVATKLTTSNMVTFIDTDDEYLLHERLGLIIETLNEIER